jgi:flagellar basal body rod protein FlgG
MRDKSLVNDFIELYKIATSNESLRENIEPIHLIEMSKLTAQETGLPVDIWIDEGGTFTKSGHGKRIKFQGDKNNPNTYNWVPLTVSEDPQIPIKNIKHNLNNQEIGQIKLFVAKNLDILNKLGNDGFGIIAFAKQMQRV